MNGNVKFEDALAARLELIQPSRNDITTGSFVIKILSARFWFISRVLLVSQFPPAPDFLEFLY